MVSGGGSVEPSVRVEDEASASAEAWESAVGVGVGVGVAVAVGVGVGPPARLNAPILSRHPIALVVGTYSLMYQNVVSSVGSTTSAV